MMKLKQGSYYVIREDAPEPEIEAYVTGVLLDSKQTITPFPFGYGRVEEHLIDSFYYLKVNSHYSEPGELPDKLSLSASGSAGTFVVSSKVRETLSAHLPKGAIEYYGLQMLWDDEVIDGYYIANVIEEIKCIDHESSRVIYWDESEEEVFEIDHLVLNPQKLPANDDIQIFRLGEMRASVLVVNAHFKSLIERTGITGFNFVETGKLIM